MKVPISILATMGGMAAVMSIAALPAGSTVAPTADVTVTTDAPRKLKASSSATATPTTTATPTAERTWGPGYCPPCGRG